MATKNTAEKWKEVKFDFRFTGNYRLEASNLGNLRAHNKFSAGEPLKGSTINGYRIIRLKFFKPKDSNAKQTLDAKQAAVVALQRKIAAWKQSLGNKSTDKALAKKIRGQISDAAEKVNTMRTDLRRRRAADVRERTIYYHSLVHRLIAEYFCTAKSPKHSVVGHLNYDKMDNRSENLKWMTPEENYRHQLSSPYVIEEKKLRASGEAPRNAKLTAAKVSQLKKMLNQGKSVEALSKKFNVTGTQILRIRSGANWGTVKAAQ